MWSRSCLDAAKTLREEFEGEILSQGPSQPSYQPFEYDSAEDIRSISHVSDRVSVIPGGVRTREYYYELCCNATQYVKISTGNTSGSLCPLDTFSTRAHPENSPFRQTTCLEPRSSIINKAVSMNTTCIYPGSLLFVSYSIAMSVP